MKLHRLQLPTTKLITFAVMIKKSLYLFIKRLLDIVFAFILLVLLSPIMILIAILLWVSLREFPVFTQKRIGKNNCSFTLIKFKTMNTRRDSNGYLLPDEVRLTKMGKKIRSLSLDELPQLINVLKGDMSFIGPRPLLPEYLPLYSKEQIRRHEVKPGISGWAQVNGRNAISWQEKFRLDVEYVDAISLFLDMKILWMTIVKVFRKEGISSGTSATMERFTGNN